MRRWEGGPHRGYIHENDCSRQGAPWASCSAVQRTNQRRILPPRLDLGLRRRPARTRQRGVPPMRRWEGGPHRGYIHENDCSRQGAPWASCSAIWRTNQRRIWPPRLDLGLRKRPARTRQKGVPPMRRWEGGPHRGYIHENDCSRQGAPWASCSAIWRTNQRRIWPPRLDLGLGKRPARTRQRGVPPMRRWEGGPHRGYIHENDCSRQGAPWASCSAVWRTNQRRIWPPRLDLGLRKRPARTRHRGVPLMRRWEGGPHRGYK